MCDNHDHYLIDAIFIPGSGLEFFYFNFENQESSEKCHRLIHREYKKQDGMTYSICTTHKK